MSKPDWYEYVNEVDDIALAVTLKVPHMASSSGQNPGILTTDGLTLAVRRIVKISQDDAGAVWVKLRLWKRQTGRGGSSGPPIDFGTIGEDSRSVIEVNRGGPLFARGGSPGAIGEIAGSDDFLGYEPPDSGNLQLDRDADIEVQASQIISFERIERFPPVLAVAAAVAEEPPVE